MKNLGFISIFTLLLAATACSGDNPAAEPAPAPDAQMRFYGVATPGDRTRGAAQHDRLWHNGTTIRVGFLGGSPAMQAKVEQYAREWETYANITFKFVESGDAHVRVGFDWNDNRYVTWSYIGTDCKTVTDQNEATLSFAYLEYMPEDVVRGDVLRAFGQVLGLELESRNINFAPQWSPNPNMAPNYWALNIGDAAWAELKKYVFDPLDADNALSTGEYDPLSIMRWPFPPNVLLNGGGAAGSNTTLSDDDKAFIAELYPSDVIAMFVADYAFSLGVSKDNAVIIDWADGTKEPVFSDLYDNYYWRGIRDMVTLRGDAEALTEIWIPYVKYIDVSKATHLRSFTCYKSPREYNLTALDLSHNSLLEYLYCSDNALMSLDVSNNPLINYIECGGNPFLEDQSAMVAFANSLPDRTGLTAGELHLMYGMEHPEWIADICAAKNWTMVY